MFILLGNKRILHLYVPNNIASNYKKQKWTELQEKSQNSHLSGKY